MTQSGKSEKKDRTTGGNRITTTQTAREGGLVPERKLLFKRTLMQN